jgi:hypothetical protein
VVEGAVRGRAAVTGVAGGSRAGERGDVAGAVDAADPVAEFLADIDVADRVDDHAPGVVELGLGGRAAVACRAGRPRPRHGVDDPAGVDAADPVIVAVGHEDGAVTGAPHGGRGVEHGQVGPAAVTGVTRLAVAGHHAEDTFGRDAAHPVVPAVAEVDRPVGRGDDRLGVLHLRLDGRGADPRFPGSADAGHGGDGPGGVDLADAVVGAVGDVDVARLVDGHAVGRVERRLRRRPPVAREGGGAVAGHGGDDPLGVDLADAVVQGVGEEGVARRIEGEGTGLVQLGPGGRAAVAAEAV